MLEIRKLTNHGGSLYVPLPLRLVQAANLRKGEFVTINIEADGSIRLKRIHNPDVNPRPVEQRA